ncbi:hypothetical protein QE197_21350 (plasmid) [Arsenophonus nasoniae]|uniref:Fimbrial protein n=1 Tax=Arsenophonus nasoniae TaxID=638 RepID=A0A4P7L5D8_9GAMM|nr:hypothetical protein [Arsenophonus nasoniae]QBY46220.1 hypothetical protein ArsFIN_48310 [Arsenophonus nasoniae]WGM08137.1 hypothetical protein QE258_22940 [Arsenophonus nasoniae]WGM13149.1 hypothetical protein QE197_21350 [Arsenophonus nasoniae]WGM17719.1 hypothetical protein QE193_21560 [Arsenophonus nasoniae]
MKKIALIMSMLFFYTGSALALECKVLGETNDPYRETKIVDNVLLPKDSNNGEKIWVSELFTRNVECTSYISEPVYFYYFPEVDISVIPKGMKFGITYNGKDTDLDASIPEKQRRLKTDIEVQASNPKRGTIAVKVYIKKEGTFDINNSVKILNIFQLDGEKGLNNTPKGNYRFSLSGLNNITQIDCSSSYYWKKFNLNINNDITLNPQSVSNIGGLNLTCQAHNNLNLDNKRVTLEVYSDSTKSSEVFTTNLTGLNFTFNIAGQELKPNNKKLITIPLDASGKNNINIDGLFKLNYQETGQDWLYNPNTLTFSPEKISIKSTLKLIE